MSSEKYIGMDVFAGRFRENLPSESKPEAWNFRMGRPALRSPQPAEPIPIRPGFRLAESYFARDAKADLGLRISPSACNFCTANCLTVVHWCPLPREHSQTMKYLAFLLLAGGIASAQVAPPSEPGMYVQTGSGFTKIIGQIAQFTRS